MRKRSPLRLALVLVLCLTGCRSAAVEVRVHRFDMGPQPAHAPSPHRSDDAVAAMITLPFGDAGSPGPRTAVNGMPASGFTRENAKDAAIATMLIATFVALAVLSVSVTANSFSSD